MNLRGRAFQRNSLRQGLGRQLLHLAGRGLQWLVPCWGRLQHLHSRYGCLRGGLYKIEIVLTVF